MVGALELLILITRRKLVVVLNGINDQYWHVEIPKDYRGNHGCDRPLEEGRQRGPSQEIEQAGRLSCASHAERPRLTIHLPSSP